MFIRYFDDYLVRGMPASWMGYIMIAMGILGLLGVNVFWGGPLNKRIDREESRN